MCVRVRTFIAPRTSPGVRRTRRSGPGRRPRKRRAPAQSTTASPYTGPNTVHTPARVSLCLCPYGRCALPFVLVDLCTCVSVDLCVRYGLQCTRVLCLQPTEGNGPPASEDSGGGSGVGAGSDPPRPPLGGICRVGTGTAQGEVRRVRDVPGGGPGQGCHPHRNGVRSQTGGPFELKPVGRG